MSSFIPHRYKHVETDYSAYQNMQLHFEKPIFCSIIKLWWLGYRSGGTDRFAGRGRAAVLSSGSSLAS